MKSLLKMAFAGVVIAGSMLTLCGCTEEGQAPAKPGMAPAAEHKPAMMQAVFVCPDCHAMALNAGKCSMCGKEMAEKHMLGMKDGKVFVCECHAGCTCNATGMKDGKCSCGKSVQEVSAKGMYVCACPNGKCCSMVSDKPGKCGCGADLKKVE